MSMQISHINTFVRPQICTCLLIEPMSYPRDVVKSPPKGTALHIVRAEESDRWPDGEWERLNQAAQKQAQVRAQQQHCALKVHDTMRLRPMMTRPT